MIALLLTIVLSWPPPPSWHDLAAADRCEARPASCSWETPTPGTLDAIAAIESGDNWRAVGRGGACLGAFQLCSRRSHLPWPLAFVRPLAAVEASRQLSGWIALANGELSPALRAYRCGFAGLHNKCGQRYAAAVERRMAARRR